MHSFGCAPRASRPEVRSSSASSRDVPRTGQGTWPRTERRKAAAAAHFRTVIPVDWLASDGSVDRPQKWMRCIDFEVRVDFVWHANVIRFPISCSPIVCAFHDGRRSSSQAPTKYRESLRQSDGTNQHIDRFVCCCSTNAPTSTANRSRGGRQSSAFDQGTGLN